jgi:Domain of Unknown Function (DUF1206)
MVETLARLGYICKAFIYTIIGSLAIAAALRRGGRITDTSGALRVILNQPFGRAILLVLTIGLCGYALWRVLDAVRDPDHHGTDFNGIVTRIGNLIRAAIYGGLGLESFRLFRGMRGSNGREAQLWTARLLDIPFGQFLVGLLGAIVSVYGVSEIIASFKGGYSRTLDITPIPAALRGAAEGISRFGIGARGVIIIVLGVFLVRAAFENDPTEAHGTRESMLELANAVDGPWLLGFIGAGLLAYAVDQAIHARCRRIKPVT